MNGSERLFGIVSRSTADAALFDDAIACDEVRQASFIPGEQDQACSQLHNARGEAFLQAVAVVEDSRSEDPDEHTPAGLVLSRIEARLDLLTNLVAALVQYRGHSDNGQQLRWSALGACLRVPEAVDAGAAGTFQIQPVDWLPQTLQLPASVVACAQENDGARLWLRFEGLSPGLSSALERHLFRVHRRAIAESRRLR